MPYYYFPNFSKFGLMLILKRKALQEEAAKTKCKILMKEFNFQCKEVKKAVAKDEKEFFEKGFDDGMDSAKAWRTANELLGTIKKLITNSNSSSGRWRRLSRVNQ